MEIMSLLDEFENVVEESSRIPMTGKVIINEDILYNFLDKLRATMPEAIREAEWILREREKMISEAEKEAETIIETGKSKL
ncbi:MAG: ATPase, partial [Clostridia bacterium]|nr:ATPase [Clostridia bacterium]